MKMSSIFRAARLLSVFVLLAAFAYSCSTVNSIKSKIGGNQANLVGTKWQLADNVKGKTPTMIIEAGKVTGNGGCNNYFGELMLDATVGNFSASNVGSTRMSCPSMSEETNFFSMLSAATKYVVTGNTLELYKDKLLLMKFTKM